MKVPLFILLLGWPIAAGAWQVESSTRAGETAGVFRYEVTARADGAEVEINAAVFDGARHTLVVLDRPTLGVRNLAHAMQKSRAIAGVNGSYFHADDTPLGLVISDGRPLHPLERSKLLGGLFVTTRDRLRLLRTAEYAPSKQTREALQAGPFLVDAGLPVAGLNRERSAKRTVVATDGKTAWALLVVTHVTLAELADLLATPGLIPGLRVVRALNLDGGGSTGFWFRADPEPFYQPEFSTVRNYVGIVPRSGK